MTQCYNGEYAVVFRASSDGTGKLQMSTSERDRMKDFLNKIRGPVEVVFRNPTPERSYDQNRYYWGVVLKLISDHSGHTPQELHEIFKEKFGVESTSNISTKAFSEYIERIIALAANNGIVIPSAEQSYRTHRQ